MFRHFDGLDHVAERLGHLGVLDEPIAVHVEVLVQRHPGGFQHGGPEHAVRLQYILGDEVLAGPVRGILVAVGPAEGGNIVEQRVKPHVTDVILVERQLDAPFEAGFRTRNAQVFQRAAFDHRQHFIAVALGTDEVGIFADMPGKPRQVLGHAEEVVLLLNEVRLGQVLRAQAVFQFLFGVETLAARAVTPAVLAEIDVAVVVHLLEERLHAGLVIGIRRTDELIVLDAELGPQGLELAADAVHEFLRGLPGRFGGLDDLVAVLVRAGQEPRILAEQRMETAQAVRNDGRIGVPKVRAGVHVINRCRNVKRGGHGKAPFMVFRICRP